MGRPTYRNRIGDTVWGHMVFIILDAYSFKTLSLGHNRSKRYSNLGCNLFYTGSPPVFYITGPKYILGPDSAYELDTSGYHPPDTIFGACPGRLKNGPYCIFMVEERQKTGSKTGLVMGAAAGLGFGVFEAVWIHNSLFASGWDWNTSVGTTGLIFGLLPFWERFFAVAFHTASSAIAGWGLAKGRGWQFYLIVSFAHALLNYSVVLYTANYLDQLQVSIYVAVLSLITTAVALWLRYNKDSRA